MLDNSGRCSDVKRQTETFLNGLPFLWYLALNSLQIPKAICHAILCQSYSSILVIQYLKSGIHHFFLHVQQSSGLSLNP